VLSALVAFEAAERHGSFSRTADELSLTQSTISRRVKSARRNARVAAEVRIRSRRRNLAADAGQQNDRNHARFRYNTAQAENELS
jgi:LysR family glycine cleavage system transcriptional activator